jgi:hypothetical protein
LERLDLTARVSSDLNPPASAELLAVIESQLGEAGEPFKQLYSLHDGMTLYRDSRSDTAGISFFPVEEWSARSQDMRDDLTSMGWPDDEMPVWLKEGIAFGEIPHSANFFVVGVGEDAGKIFYADHDDFRDAPIAENLEEFLDRIRSDPADFLYQCGCYTRYEDDETDIQWIPKEYVADVGDHVN